MMQGFKVSLPEHVPMQYVWPALGFLFGVQMLEGTHLLTSLTYCAFVLVLVDAFNTVGGLVYPSGSYIFFVGLLTAGVGGMAKTVLGEPLDSNLFNTQKSLLVYLAGACAIWGAAKVNVAIRRKRPLLWKTQLTSNVVQAAVGALLFSQFGWILVPMAYMSTFSQLNRFGPLALLLAVYANVKKSGGEKSYSTFAFLMWVYFTTVGIFAFSKEAMFTPSVSWVIGATMAGYRLTLRRALFVGVVATILSAILAPVSQVGRVYRLDANSNEVAIDLLTHPLRTREIYEMQQSYIREDKGYHWFDRPQGLLDRMTMLPIDDALIRRTDRGFSPGILPMETYAANMIPRYLIGEKFVYHWGNQYAHEIGMLGARDMTTGISFSPFGDAYHQMQWWGVTLISFPIFLMMFFVCDSLAGSTHDTIWASIYILIFAHTAAEGMMNAPFGAMSVGSVLVVFAAVMGRYVLPTLGGVLTLSRPAVGPPLPVKPIWHSQRPSLVQSGPRTIEEKL
ncbi:MAG: hypothetical protein V4734_02890 [Terriglobus sp.]